jgi:hypothetical protein
MNLEPSYTLNLSWKSAKSIKKLSAIKKRGIDNPNLFAKSKNISPEKSSIKGYCIDILV